LKQDKRAATCLVLGIAFLSTVKDDAISRIVPIRLGGELTKAACEPGYL
jgi:hypothetical protein